MQLSYHKVDLQSHEQKGLTYGDIIQRQRKGEIWAVPFSPIDFSSKTDFRHYRREDSVYIPMFPYVTPSDPADAMGFAFQLGAAAVNMLPHNQGVSRLHLSLGQPLEHITEGNGDTKLRFFLGFAFLLSR